jgi:hypothetical protein
LQGTHVRPIQHPNPLIGTQRPGQLPVTDVDCDHFPSAAVQQHVGETASGRPGVQAAPTLDGRASAHEAVQRAEQLLGAARHPVRLVVIALNQHRGVRIDAGGRLDSHHPANSYPALGDELGCVVTRSGQAPPHQLRVQSGPTRHLNLVDARQGLGQGVVDCTQAGYVCRSRQLIETVQTRERIGDAGSGTG